MSALFAAALLAAAAPGSAQTAPATCTLERGDQAWLDGAERAWRISARTITRIHLPRRFEAWIFDARCVARSATALAGGPAHWRGSEHRGTIALPDGSKIPARATSFASVHAGEAFFVMAAPSLWRAGKVDGGPLGLETLMTAVLVHEATHVAQLATYGARMERLSAQWHLPAEFNDDSIQARFGADPAYAAAVAEETRLLLAAAATPDRRAATRLARQALTSIRARQARAFPARDGYLVDADDIWLTMEGSAQWAAYAWLISPRGGRIARAKALKAFGQRGKWWSQTQGFALFMALDRLAGESWKRHAFGDGAKTGLEMLSEAVGA